MCYKAVHVTDSKNGIVVAAGATHADEGEVAAREPILDEAKSNLAECGLSLEVVAADAGFDSADFHAHVEDMGAEPVTNYRADTTKKPEGFKKESFIYHEEANCYICPEGYLLRCKYCSNGLTIYAAQVSDCAACPSREKCIGDEGRRRTIARHPKEESRERNIARCHTEEGRDILRRRKHIVEPPFGHMKTY